MSTNKNPAILHTNQQEQQYNNQLYQQHAFMQRGVEGVGFNVGLSQQHSYQQPAGTQPMPQLQSNTIRSNPQQPQQDVNKIQHQLTQHNATHRYNAMPNQNTYRSSQQQPQLQPQGRVTRPPTPFIQPNTFVVQNYPSTRYYQYQPQPYIPGMQAAFYSIQARPTFLNPNIQPNPSNLVPSTPPPLQQTIISPMPGPAAVPLNQSKTRSRAVKIINPDTKEEVKVGNDESSTNDEPKHIHIEKYDNETNYMTEYNPYVDTQTPVVSAMSDGPSVEILHKQKVKRKTIEVVEEKQISGEQHVVDDEFNNGAVVTCSLLQTSAVEFQPSKPPPPIIIQSREPIKDEQHIMVAPVDDALGNLNHVEDVQEVYVHVDIIDDDIATEPEAEIAIEEQDTGVTTSSTDETDKSVIVAVPDEIECSTDMASDKKKVLEANVEEVIEAIADISLDSISSDENLSRDKIDESLIIEPTPPLPVVAKQPPNSLANTGFGNAIMEELRAGHIAQQSAQQQLAQQQAAQQQAAQQQEGPPKRAASRSQSLLQYEQGQWSPSNSDGKKYYNREQMFALRTHPASQTQPACQLGAIGVTSKPNQQLSGNYKQVLRQNSGFGKRSSQNSQQGGISANNKSNKAPMIHLSLSLNADVKLNETENAWKPSFIAESNSDQVSSEVLYKRVRGILNKLTPEKFETLLEQIRGFDIDTAERLNGVIVLVFEKAIDEPNFSVAYAQLCHKLSERCFTNDSESKLLQFKKTLISKCQNEFQSHVIVDESKVAEKLQPFLQKIMDATDPERKAEYQANYEDEERKLRRRSVGTVRFIGELFKIGMLTPNIMMNCVQTLLDRNSEDKLECLCKLLTTIGSRLEDKKTPGNARDLGTYFQTMKEIVEKKNQSSKISSRVRFMIQDVIDLRKNNWIPRRETANPKKMGQIQKEADAEQSTMQLLNYNLSSTRRDDRGGGGGGGGGGVGNRGGNERDRDRDRGGLYNQKSVRGGNNLGEDGWMTTTSSKSRSLIDPSKFKFKNVDDSTTLGTASQFKWSGNTNTPLTTTQTNNSFSILEGGTRSGSMGGNKDSYSKGSMERDRYDNRGGSNSRGGSQHGSRENSVADRSYTLKPMTNRVASQSMTMMSGSRPSDRPQQPIVQREERDEPNEELSNKIKVIANDLLQYHNRGEIKLESCYYEVEPISEKYRWAIVRELYNSCVAIHQLKSTDRVFAGEAVADWINRKLINVGDNRRALKEFLEPALDLVFDVPMIWVYIAEFITPLIKNNSLSLKEIRSVCPEEHVLEQMEKILQHFIPYATTEHGPQFVRNLFKEYEWSDFVSDDKKFVSKNKFEFVKDNGVVIQRTTTGATNIEFIQKRVKEFLNDGAEINAIQDFITIHLAQIDTEFIRALSTAVAETLMEDKTLKFSDPKHATGITLLIKYIDDKDELQMQCLNAIQILLNKLEYPKDALRMIFSRLFDDYVVSKCVFGMWRDSKETFEGKGVAVSNLRTFFELVEKDGSSAEEDNN